MKTKLKLFAISYLLSAISFYAHAQGTAFTYQGRLNTNGAAYSGSAEFQFTLWDAASGGSAVATNNPTSFIATVDNGLFTVTLDFGTNPFNGQPRFLQTDVRTVIGPFTTLSPRQPLTATPYALRALNLTTNGLAGTYGNAVTFNNAGNSFVGGFTGTFTGAASGNGSGLTNVNAATLSGLAATTFWKTNGNTGANPTNGAFLGTADNLPLEFKVNSQRALRFEPTAFGGPNVIGGSSGNGVTAGLFGTTIGGGDGNTILLTGDPLLASSSVIAGGAQNVIGRPASGSITLGGCNSIGGGSQNSIRTGGDFDTIAGGSGNTIGTNSDYATIAGGNGNSVGNDSSDGVIGGGSGNTIGTNSGNAVIGGGDANQIGNNSTYATIPAGLANQIGANALQSVIGGGGNNFIHDNSGGATIAGGIANQVGTNAANSAIGGGNNNRIANNASFGTVPGGDSNSATNWAFAAGRRAKANHQGAFVWADSQNADFASTGTNQFLIRAAGGVGIGTTSPTRDLEVQNAGATEIGIKSTDTGGHLWTLQSSGVTGSASLDASFQIIDRTAGGARFFIGTNGFVGIGTSNPTNRLHINGGVSATAFVTTSDRNAKENFTAISPSDVLAKVAALPITKWNFKAMKDGQHLGPMAQDFYAAFGLGGGETTITTVDADGVALAAIQGLNQKVEQKEAEIHRLSQRLADMEKLVTRLVEAKN